MTAEEIAEEQKIKTPEDEKAEKLNEFLKESEGDGNEEAEDKAQTDEERKAILAEASGETDKTLEGKSYEIAAKAATMLINGVYQVGFPWWAKMRHDIRITQKDINTLTFSKAEFAQVQNAFENVFAYYKILGDANPLVQLGVILTVTTVARIEMLGGIVETQKLKDENTILKNQQAQLQKELEQLRKEREEKPKPKAKVIPIHEPEPEAEPEEKETPVIKKERPAAKKRGPKPKA